MLFLFADLILIFHLLIIIFVSSLFFFIPIGYYKDWKWTRNFLLRITHICLITFITVETFFGIICPLTIFENHLRNILTETSLINLWVSKLIYWNLPTSYFLTIYSLCFIWTLFMWFYFPPKGKKIIKS